MAPPAVSISVAVNPKDVARLTKRLDKWQGKPLADRMAKAEQAGLGLYVGALRMRAARHNLTGETMRSIKVTKLRTRSGEVAAYKVGPTSRHRPFAIVGTSRGVEADPYVDEVYQSLEPTVTAFIDEQVRRLA
jgi:hypothetical protein